MNEDDRLKPHSCAYAFIAYEALSNRFATVLNRHYKSESIDAMMVPMNIRQDDIYYTLANMKRSKLDGAVISFEYMKDAVEHLDVKSDMVKSVDLCDLIIIKEGKFYGDFIFAKALFNFLKDKSAKKIAVIGANSFAKSIYELHCECEVSFFDEYVEDYLPLHMQNADINRVSKDNIYDFSSYDVLIDLSEMKDLSMIEKFAKIGVDMKKESSMLRERSENYYGYNEFLEFYTKEADKFFSKGLEDEI